MYTKIFFVRGTVCSEYYRRLLITQNDEFHLDLLSEYSSLGIFRKQGFKVNVPQWLSDRTGTDERG